ISASLSAACMIGIA
ncbi:hypothetical protein A2U01_0083921, partial [Trifolium medium]|nr:hypothetical protein [Trifolium medium]